MSETNYQRYFGTESKTAMMLSDLCQAIRSCAACPFYNEQEDICPFGNNPALAEEWLESEAE